MDLILFDILFPFNNILIALIWQQVIPKRLVTTEIIRLMGHLRNNYSFCFIF